VRRLASTIMGLHGSRVIPSFFLPVLLVVLEASTTLSRSLVNASQLIYRRAVDRPRALLRVGDVQSILLPYPHWILRNPPPQQR
jgi:hypothetical protein